MNKLKDNNFELGNANRLDRINDESARAREQFGEDPTGEFERIIKLAPDASHTKAADYMSHQKDFRDAIHNLYQDAQHAGREGSSVRAAELFRVARGLKPFEDLVNETLREGLGEHLDTYDTLQRGYREQVRPLRENDVANKVTSGKPMSANIAEELNGNQRGQPLLRELAKQNPEILRNIVGQHDLKDVVNPDEVLREYTNEMPELQKLTKAREQAINNKNESKNSLDNANEAHQNNISLNKENEKNQTEVNKKIAVKNQLTEKNDLLSQFKDKIQQRQKNMTDAQIEHDNLTEANQQHEKVKNDIDKLDKIMPILEKHLSDILKTSEEKGKFENEVKNLESKQKTYAKAKAKFEEQKDNLEKTIKDAEQHIPVLQEAEKNVNLSKQERMAVKKDIQRVKKSVLKSRLIFSALSGLYFSYKGMGVLRAIFSGNNKEGE